MRDEFQRTRCLKSAVTVVGVFVRIRASGSKATARTKYERSAVQAACAGVRGSSRVIASPFQRAQQASQVSQVSSPGPVCASGRGGALLVAKRGGGAPSHHESQ